MIRFVSLPGIKIYFMKKYTEKVLESVGRAGKVHKRK